MDDGGVFPARGLGRGISMFDKRYTSTQPIGAVSAATVTNCTSFVVSSSGQSSSSQSGESPSQTANTKLSQLDVIGGAEPCPIDAQYWIPELLPNIEEPRWSKDIFRCGFGIIGTVFEGTGTLYMASVGVAQFSAQAVTAYRNVRNAHQQQLPQSVALFDFLQPFQTVRFQMRKEAAPFNNKFNVPRFVIDIIEPDLKPFTVLRDCEILSCHVKHFTSPDLAILTTGEAPEIDILLHVSAFPRYIAKISDATTPGEFLHVLVFKNLCRHTVPAQYQQFSKRVLRVFDRKIESVQDLMEETYKFRARAKEAPVFNATATSSSSRRPFVRSNAADLNVHSLAHRALKLPQPSVSTTLPGATRKGH